MNNLLDWFDTLDRPRKALIFLAIFPYWLLFKRMRLKVKGLFITVWAGVRKRWEVARAWAGAPRTAAARIWSSLRGKPVPSPSLINFVTGSDDPDWFLSSGKLGAKSIREVLKRNNIKLGRSP